MTTALALRDVLADHDGRSLAEILADLPPAPLERIMGGLTDAEIEALLGDWHFYARAKQLPPPEPWTFWGIRSGRGFGKTRTGAEWFHRRAMDGDDRRWMALVARNPAEARDINIEGPAGLLKIAPPAERPHYEPSKRRLTWPTGAWATIYSGENPDQARGFSGDTAWFDELASYQYPRDTWDNVLFGVREARVAAPQILVTTTPRPIAFIRELVVDPAFAWTTGSSYENRANLDPRWFAQILSRYAGTTTGRQEIFGEMLDESPGALWKLKWLESGRLPIQAPRPPTAQELERMRLIIVGVDPPASSRGRCGIYAVGVTREPDGREHGHVIGNASCSGTPARWGQAAIELYDELDADRLVAEINNGGEMVEHTIRTLPGGREVVYQGIHASRGKRPRAEPVAARYEQGLVHHWGIYPELEDQMCNWVPDEGDSPDDLDALVWAATAALGLGRHATRARLPRILRDQ